MEDIDVPVKTQERNQTEETQFLRPPNPLIPKRNIPSEPAFQSQNIPFMKLALFYGREETCASGPVVDRGKFPKPFSSDRSLQDFFKEDKLVYIRNPPSYSRNLKSKTFNENRCEVKRLLNRQKMLSKHQRNFSNSLLVNSLDTYYQPTERDQTLVFESRFESGNLELASKLSDNEYNLLLQVDTNSKGHTQWFFFRVTNTRAAMTVKFNILNFVKKDSLFNLGMKITCYSSTRSTLEGIGWSRTGENIMYYPNGLPKDQKTYYTLTFSHTFKYSKDEVFFAYSVPYTYTQLQDLLGSYESDWAISQCLIRRTMCRTLSGNACDCLTITNMASANQNKEKKAVVLSARVHPGESVSSWVMQGFLDFITGNSPEAETLREKYIFRVIPMLNPDGVINGNYRCSCAGKDLNRAWKSPSHILHPTIYNTKKMILKLGSSYNVELICDFHGHSRKHNVFMYGCNIKRKPHKCKIFPFMMSKTSEVFSYRNCSFGIQKSKLSTMRVILFSELNVPSVYTLESSFSGTRDMHFSVHNLMGVGRDFALCLLALTKESPQYSIAMEEIMNNEELLHQGENSGSSSSGSDSDPSADELSIAEIQELMGETKISERERREIPKKVLERKTIQLPAMQRRYTHIEEEVSSTNYNAFIQSAVQTPSFSVCPTIRTVTTNITQQFRTLKSKSQSRQKPYKLQTGKMVCDRSTQTPPDFYKKPLPEHRTAHSFSNSFELADTHHTRNSVGANSRYDIRSPEPFKELKRTFFWGKRLPCVKKKRHSEVKEPSPFADLCISRTNTPSKLIQCESPNRNFPGKAYSSKTPQLFWSPPLNLRASRRKKNLVAISHKI